MDAALRDALVAAAHSWSGDPAPVTLRVERDVIRPLSRLRVVRVGIGRNERRLIVKQPRPGLDPARASLAPDRPRFGPLADITTRYELEYKTLTAVRSALGQKSDPILGSVVVHAYLPDSQTIVMDLIDAPTLRTVLNRTPFRGAAAAERGAAMAGRWLRAYHDMPMMPETVVRQSSRDEVLDLVARQAVYLRLPTTDSAPVGALVAKLRERLPDHPPIRLGHGDFAPRNIFVEADRRVISIDMWGRWAPPVYEDLACFLVSIWTARQQMLLRGRYFSTALLRQIEAAFLDSYGTAITDLAPAVRAYAGVVLLDRWTAHRARAAQLSSRVATHAHQLEDRSYARLVSELATLD